MINIKSTLVVAGLLAGPAAAQSTASAYGQCGGSGWTGATLCPSGFTCQSNGNVYYAQCVPGAASTTSKSSAPVTTSSKASTPVSTTSTTASAPTSSSGGGGSTSGSPTGFLGGVNLAGFDFGIDTTGTSSGSPVTPPTSQIAHFASEGVNIFRVPVGWQYLENTPGAGLNAAFFSTYNSFIQSALSASTSPYVIIDLHNYARYNGQIIGAGGPTCAQFAEVWGALAAKYASNSKIIFGLMNEPHDVNLSSFAVCLQAAVKSIRAAGAKTQYILLPGNDWTHASSFISMNEATLSTITDPVGGTNLLVFDLHQYLDSDGSGTQNTCTTDRVQDTFVPVAAELRKTGRKALVSEIGGTNDASCQKYLNNALASIKANSDVYLGYTAWAAGAFDSSYLLSLTPTGNTDTVIFNAAVKPNLPGGGKMKKRLHKARRSE